MSDDPSFNNDWLIFHDEDEDEEDLFLDVDVDQEVEKWFKEYVLPDEEKCECGGDKLRLPHSHWCPKFNKRT